MTRLYIQFYAKIYFSNSSNEGGSKNRKMNDYITQESMRSSGSNVFSSDFLAT